MISSTVSPAVVAKHRTRLQRAAVSAVDAPSRGTWAVLVAAAALPVVEATAEEIASSRSEEVVVTTNVRTGEEHTWVMAAVRSVPVVVELAMAFATAAGRQALVSAVAMVT